MANYKVTDTELSSIADAIRTKASLSSQLVFPSGFISAVQAIPTGSGVYVMKSISANGTYNPSDDNADAYSQVVVDVPSGGGGGIEFFTPSFYSGASDEAKDLIAFFDGLYVNILGRIDLSTSFNANSPIFRIPSIYKIPATQYAWCGKANDSPVNGLVNTDGDVFFASAQNTYTYVDIKAFATKGTITPITEDSTKFDLQSGGVVQCGNLQIGVAYGTFKQRNTWVTDMFDFFGDAIMASRIISSRTIYADTATNYGTINGVYPSTSSSPYCVTIYKNNSN